MKFFGCVLFLCVVLSCRGDIDLGTCNLQCNGDSPSTSTSFPPRIQGRPGKQGAIGGVGPRGPKGQKGNPAKMCECLDAQTLKDEDEAEQFSSEDTDDFQQPTPLLTQASNAAETMFPKSCASIRSLNVDSNSGVYSIHPKGFTDLVGLKVYCDLNTDNDGWLVFQKRIDGSENFFRNFDDYVRGFGSLSGEFWLGLDVLHDLTKDGEYEMRVDMEDFENKTRYALYSNFVVGQPVLDYTLTVGGYSGTAGDAMQRQQGAMFSTKDSDQDRQSHEDCANLYKGGWWYSDCHDANPNGLYFEGSHESFADGINWRQWRGYHYSYRRIEMKLRRK